MPHGCFWLHNQWCNNAHSCMTAWWDLVKGGHELTHNTPEYLQTCDLALDPCLIYDTDRYGWIWDSLCACAPARRHCRRLPSGTPGHHRGLRDFTRVWRQRYQIMVVQALTEQIPEPIVFWFVIFGFVAKCVIHCMFDGMQDSSISTKTWSCKID